MKKENKKVYLLNDSDVIDAQRCLGDIALEYVRQNPEEFADFLKQKKIQSKEKNDEKEK